MSTIARVAAALALPLALIWVAPPGADAATKIIANSMSTTTTAATGCTNAVINNIAYKCTFSDEFTSLRLDRTKWTVNTGFVTGDPTAGYACTVDDPRYIAQSAGALHLMAAKVTKPALCNGMPATNYEAPTISTHGLFSQKYGRYEIRMRTTATTAPGLQESFWLWPDDRYTAINWPTTGEIDVAETYSNYPDLVVPFLHYTANDNGGPVPGLNTAWNCSAQRGVWTTYTLDWTPASLTISVNGVPCLVNTSADPAFQQRYILMISQALGGGSNAMTANTTLPAVTDVDYVRVWQAL